MAELTMRVRLNMVKYFLEGLSNEEIGRKCGVAKGSVNNVITMLKEGQFPACRELEEQVDTLREVAVQIHRSGLSLAQTAIGLSAFRTIAELGVPPAEVGRLAAWLRDFAPDDMESGEFVRAAGALLESQERTGKGPEELAVWVGDLEERATALADRCQELAPLAEEVEILRGQRDRLVQENAARAGELQQEQQSLEQAVVGLKADLARLETQVLESQRLAGDLGRRFLDREDELQQVSRRLAEATRAIDELADLGLPLERLPDLAARLGCQARRQGIGADQCWEWFLSCLEGASSLLGLESQVQVKLGQLREAEREMVVVSRKRDAAAGDLAGLTQQATELKAGQRAMRQAWQREMRSIANTIQHEVAEGAERWRAAAEASDLEVRLRLLKLSDTAVALGRLEEALDSYALVRPLVNLLQGKAELSLSEARVAATALCLGLLGYLEGNAGNPASAAQVGLRVKSLLEALHNWRA